MNKKYLLNGIVRGLTFSVTIILIAIIWFWIDLGHRCGLFSGDLCTLPAFFSDYFFTKEIVIQIFFMMLAAIAVEYFSKNSWLIRALKTILTFMISLFMANTASYIINSTKYSSPINLLNNLKINFLSSSKLSIIIALLYFFFYTYIAGKKEFRKI